MAVVCWATVAYREVVSLLAWDCTVSVVEELNAWAAQELDVRMVEEVVVLLVVVAPVGSGVRLAL